MEVTCHTIWAITIHYTDESKYEIYNNYLIQYFGPIKSPLTHTCSHTYTHLRIYHSHTHRDIHIWFWDQSTKSEIIDKRSIQEQVKAIRSMFQSRGLNWIWINIASPSFTVLANCLHMPAHWSAAVLLLSKETSLA